MTMKPNWRARAKRGVERYFEERSYPRLILGLSLLLTGLAGFGISQGLFCLGMDNMGIRYPVAVIGAYAVFLLLMRIWVEFERRSFDASKLVINERESESNAPQSTLSDSKHSWYDYLDIPDLDAEGCLPLILLAVVLGLVLLLVTALIGAPVLLAEVFVDGFLAGVLYRHLRIAADEHWLGTAIRRTWLHVIGVAILLSIGGVTLSFMAPGSRTLGEAVKYFFDAQPER